MEEQRIVPELLPHNNLIHTNQKIRYRTPNNRAGINSTLNDPIDLVNRMNSVLPTRIISMFRQSHLEH
ncbi:hypothetical protein GLYMA_12G000600v4 [Glycine max]|uniref:Uncharacterized protein n=1 Tax=Glycine max TaxID=3847 RepID=I1LNM8_SOYBN|nr:hypothetical protein GYH30_032240 [Glycine max]KRH23733.1 hypothetical protein GLYMA_12G000600v4 [Glycine max]